MVPHKPLAQPSQRKRFEEMAREVGADETGESFERAFRKIVPPKRRPLNPGEAHDGKRSGRRTAPAKAK